MSNYPIFAGARSESLGIASGAGTALTTGAANTKGSWSADLTAGFAYSGFFLEVARLNGSDDLRFDVAINDAGTRTIIAADLYLTGINDVTTFTASIWCPIQVPAGKKLNVRAQAVNSSRQTSFSIRGYARDFPSNPGCGRIVSCTDFTNTYPTGQATENGTSPTASFTEICASIPATIAELFVIPTGCGDAARTDSKFSIDIYVGSAGNEVLLATIVGSQTSGVVRTKIDRIPCLLPAGTRLSFKITCNTSSADTIGVAAWGAA